MSANFFLNDIDRFPLTVWTIHRPTHLGDSPNDCMIQTLFDARKDGFVSLNHREMMNTPLNNADSATEHRRDLGRLLAIDLGGKRVGLAVSDELRITVRPVATIERRNWKELLRRIKTQVELLDARAIVIGLPLNIDGSEGPAALEAREIAAKFSRSLNLPVFLQDERLTTEEAKSHLRDIQRKRSGDVDSAAAAIILQDFIDQQQSRPVTV